LPRSTDAADHVGGKDRFRHFYRRGSKCFQGDAIEMTGSKAHQCQTETDSRDTASRLRAIANPAR
jgi:hypothetical protein